GSRRSSSATPRARSRPPRTIAPTTPLTNPQQTWSRRRRRRVPRGRTEMNPLIEWLIAPQTIFFITVAMVVFLALQISAAAMVYAERKVAAFMQQRYGPFLVGPRGLLQPIADIVKLIFKEELRPKAADALLFSAAPVISAIAAFAAFAPVPFGASTTFFGLLDEPMPLVVADINVAVLVIFAVTSMGVYGIVLAG